MSSLLIEGVAFDNDAATEILQVAKRHPDLGGQDQIRNRIIDFVVRTRGAAAHEKKIVITRGNVIAFELGLKLYDAGVFYYSSADKKFVRLLTDVIGAPHVDSHEDDFEDDEDEEEAVDADDDEGQDEDEEEGVKDRRVSEIGRSEASAFRQTGSALVKKRITRFDGTVQDIPLNPIARLDHLLPAQAVADKTKLLWEQNAMPIIRKTVGERLEKVQPVQKRLTSAGPTLAPEQRKSLEAEAKAIKEEFHNQVEKGIKAFLDYLRVATCLTDYEINLIYTDFENLIKKTTDKAPLDETVQQISETMRNAIDRVIAGKQSMRSNQSNLLKFFSPNNGGLVTKDQEIEIDSSGEITAAAIKQFGQTFESLMSKDFVKIPMTQRMKQLMDGSHTGVPGSAVADAERLSALSDLEKEAQAAQIMGLDNAPNRVFGNKGMAMSGKESTDQAVDRISAKRERTGEETKFINTIQMSRSSHNAGPGEFRGTGFAPFMPISVRVRSCETTQTLHNQYTDRQSYSATATDTKDKGQTDVDHVFHEIKQTVSKISDYSAKIASAAGDPALPQDVRALRNLVELLSGLIEYFAMSGAEVLVGEKAISMRSLLIDKSQKLHDAALDITDAIVHTYTVERHKRSPNLIAANLVSLKGDLKRIESSPATKFLSPRDQAERIEQLKASIKLLEREQGETSKRDVDRRLIEKVKQNLEIADIDAAVSECQKFLPDLRESQRSTQNVKKDSRYTISLAETRVQRIKSLERDQKVTANKLVDESGNSPIFALDKIEPAKERDERRSQDTINTVLANNRLQPHVLQMRDTIRSIFEEKKVRAYPGVKELKLGFRFRASLPRKYDKRSQLINRVYTVFADPVDDNLVELSYTDELTGQEERIKVPSKVVIASLPSQEDEKSQHALNLKSFADAIRYHASEAVRQIAQDVADSSLTAHLDIDKSLISQLAEAMFNAEKSRYLTDIRVRGINALRATMESTGCFSDEVLPVADPGRMLTMRSENALLALAALANMQGSGREFSQRVKAAFSPPGQAPSGAFFELIDVVASTDRKEASTRSSRVRNAFKDADEFLEELKTLPQAAISGRINALMSSVKEELRSIQEAQSRLSRAVQQYSTGYYADSFVGQSISVPSQQILTPGTRLTIVPPRRTLGKATREFMRILGIKPELLISKPVEGIISSIERACLVKAALPIIGLVARKTADKLAYDIFVNTIRQRFKDARASSPDKSREAQEECFKYIKSMLEDDLFPDNTRSEVISYLTPAAKAVGEAMGVSDVRVQSVKGDDVFEQKESIIALYRSLNNAVARGLTSTDGARKLYKIAPCTAVLLNVSAFSNTERVLFNILSPSAEDALEFLTYGSYNELMGGVSASKTGTTSEGVIFSRGTDRIAAAISVLNDFYTRFEKESAETKSVPQTVVSRLKRKSPSGEDSLKFAAQQLKSMGAPDSPKSDEELFSAAEKAANAIGHEISLLSTGNSTSKITLLIEEIASTIAGSNPQGMPARLDSQDEYNRCMESVAALIYSADLGTASPDAMPQTKDAASRERFDKLMDSVSDRVREALSAKYIADSRTAIEKATGVS